MWIVRERCSLRRTSPFMARTGNGPLSDLRPLSGEELKSDFGAVRSVDDPNETLGSLVYAQAAQRRPEMAPLDQMGHPHMGETT
jgi:hypothetical protein